MWSLATTCRRQSSKQQSQQGRAGLLCPWATTCPLLPSKHIGAGTGTEYSPFPSCFVTSHPCRLLTADHQREVLVVQRMGPWDAETGVAQFGLEVQEEWTAAGVTDSLFFAGTPDGDHLKFPHDPKTVQFWPDK